MNISRLFGVLDLSFKIIFKLSLTFIGFILKIVLYYDISEGKTDADIFWIFQEGEMTMEYVVSTKGLTKVYGKHTAVDNVSLHIKRGEIYGFIGRNGAGKTTFMKMLTGLAAPTAGEISLFGSTGEAMKKQTERVGNLIEDPGLYPQFSGYQNLRCKCLALGVHKEGYIEELLDMVGLSSAGKKKVKKYSLGMKQRLGIAMALVGGPDLLILDEPINGLDPQGIAEVRDILLKLRDEQNMTIMISSHILEELYKIADTFGIINKGKLIQELSKEELSAKCSDFIELKLDSASKACPVLEGMGITNYKVIGNDTIYIYDQVDNLGAINKALANAGVMVSLLNVVQERLEDYYLELVGGEKNA